ncbi:hypothetical protein M5K25_011363 [Dendrobium thyrsiflorum]|uniref:Strictosidine synthase conserved region domain-containing protein n=1 Tax=Dendrobium thyrsiflorum TaxID=117978 RepID=A0ABD0V2K4_DENTH
MGRGLQLEVTEVGASVGLKEGGETVPGSVQEIRNGAAIWQRFEQALCTVKAVMSYSEFLSAIITGDNTGRLMQYDPTTQKTQILLSNLSFPNGIALSSDGSFLLIAESTNCRILRYWLQNSSFEVFFQLPGFPDNIRRSPRGGFWVALHSRRSTLEKWLLSLPWIKKAFFYGSNLFPSSSINGVILFSKRMTNKGAMAMRLDEDGKIIEVLENPGERKMVFISEVHEMNDSLWIGSVLMPFLWRYKI